MAEANPALRVGLVGLGYWGPNLLRVLADLPNVELRWICDVDDGRRRRYARRYPAVRATASYDDLVEDPELDAIVIATPVFTHFELAARSLAAGKHTFVEKPLAPSVGEADLLLEAAAERQLTLMCGHTFLWSPPVRAIRGMLERRELGDIYFISASRVNLGLHQRDTSVIWDLAPHDFSILHYWLGGMPQSIRALGRDSIVKGIADVAFITLSYAGGLIVNVELSWLAPSKLRRTVLVGSEKMVVYEDGAPEAVRIFDHGVVYEDPETYGAYQLSYRTGDITSPKLDTTEPLAAQLGAFTAAAAAGAVLPAEALLARDVVQMLETAECSLLQGGVEVAVVPCPVPGSPG
ncbi:MAG: Gfo/Idh/MocA family protein [Solirubrobacteraceae bacterium]